MNDIDWKNVDAICCVLSEQRSSAHFYAFINHYYQSRVTLNLDYATHPLDASIIFTTEKEMISCFADTPTHSNVFFLHGHSTVSHAIIMLGAEFTVDGKTIYSVTLSANGEDEELMLKSLKDFLDSSVGMVCYDLYPEHNNAREFLALCKTWNINKSNNNGHEKNA